MHRPWSPVRRTRRVASSKPNRRRNSTSRRRPRSSRSPSPRPTGAASSAVPASYLGTWEGQALALDGTLPVGTFRLKRNGVTYPKEVSLILRPEKMRLLRQRSATQENLVEGRIEELSYLGSRTEYVVKTAHLTFKVFEPELERLQKRSLNPGDRIYLTWKSDDAIILPPSPAVMPGLTQ